MIARIGICLDRDLVIQLLITDRILLVGDHVLRKSQRAEKGSIMKRQVNAPRQFRFLVFLILVTLLVGGATLASAAEYDPHAVSTINALITNNGLGAHGFVVDSPVSWDDFATWTAHPTTGVLMLSELDFSTYTISGDATITDLSSLNRLNVSGNAGLISLDCSRNFLLGVEGLGFLDVSGCVNLIYLDCSFGYLDELDVTDCINLEYLDCMSNNIAVLDLSNSTELVSLSCSSNPLVALDLSSCTKLTELWCFYNTLTKLDVTMCPSLELLGCWGNKLTSLDVSRCPDLEILWCDNNKLTTLDLSQNTKLLDLICKSNKLRTLDVTNCPELINLECERNELTSLLVSGLSNLQTFQCDENELTELDVSGCSSMTKLSIVSNKITSLDVSDSVAGVGPLAFFLWVGDNPLRFLKFADDCTLTVQINPALGGSVMVTASNGFSNAIEFTAYAKDGYTFSDWTFTGFDISPVIEDNVISFDIPFTSFTGVITANFTGPPTPSKDEKSSVLPPTGDSAGLPVTVAIVAMLLIGAFGSKEWRTIITKNAG